MILNYHHFVLIVMYIPGTAFATLFCHANAVTIPVRSVQQRLCAASVVLQAVEVQACCLSTLLGADTQNTTTGALRVLLSAGSRPDV